ncbi:MAG: LON peptidase substrate-binding domain-containing protein [Chromatocurvus sp.]
MSDSLEDIPLFPLSAVLFPYGRMPLQIFEQRYLDLIRGCARSGTGFGVVWTSGGGEVAGRGEPVLGDYGTYARIVDYDQLPNGLLGVTIEGGAVFDLHRTERLASQLVMGSVSWRKPLARAPVHSDWEGLVSVLRSLETHPHVEQLQLDIDYDNAWAVAFNLLQLLPLDERLKYRWLGYDSVEDVVDELQTVLNEISGEDDSPS